MFLNFSHEEFDGYVIGVFYKDFNDNCYFSFNNNKKTFIVFDSIINSNDNDFKNFLTKNELLHLLSHSQKGVVNLLIRKNDDKKLVIKNLFCFKENSNVVIDLDVFSNNFLVDKEIIDKENKKCIEVEKVVEEKEEEKLNKKKDNKILIEDLNEKKQENNKKEKINNDSNVNKPNYSNAITIKRLFLMFIFTFGFYFYYWLYKNVKYINEFCEEKDKINPWLSFIPFVCFYVYYKMCKNVVKIADKISINKYFSSPWSSTGNIIGLHLIGNTISSKAEGFGILVGVIIILLQVFMLKNVQKTLNDIWAFYQPKLAIRKKFFALEFIIMFIGFLIWGLLLYSLFFIKQS